MITIDMKMPTDCNSCLIRKIMGCKIANESGWLNNRRDERCPLKELVRCNDCANGNPIEYCHMPAISCNKGMIIGQNWFCADGRKKDG